MFSARRALAAATVLSAVLLISACGGDDSTASNGSSEPDASISASPEPKELDNKTPDGVREVIGAFNDAFSRGDAEAGCELLTPEYQQQTIADAAEITDVPPANCTEALAAGIELAKAFGYDPSSALVTEPTVSGDTATVLVQAQSETFEDTTYSLVWVDDRWLISAG